MNLLTNLNRDQNQNGYNILKLFHKKDKQSKKMGNVPRSVIAEIKFVYFYQEDQ